MFFLHVLVCMQEVPEEPLRPYKAHTMVDTFVALSRENLDKVGVEEGQCKIRQDVLLTSFFQESASVSSAIFPTASFRISSTNK